MTNDDHDKSQEEINRMVFARLNAQYDWLARTRQRVDELEQKAAAAELAMESKPDTDPGIIGRNEWRKAKRIAELEKTIEDAQLELRDLRGENE